MKRFVNIKISLTVLIPVMMLLMVHVLSGSVFAGASCGVEGDHLCGGPNDVPCLGWCNSTDGCAGSHDASFICEGNMPVCGGLSPAFIGSVHYLPCGGANAIAHDPVASRSVNGKDPDGDCKDHDDMWCKTYSVTAESFEESPGVCVGVTQESDCLLYHIGDEGAGCRLPCKGGDGCPNVDPGIPAGQTGHCYMNCVGVVRPSQLDWVCETCECNNTCTQTTPPTNPETLLVNGNPEGGVPSGRPAIQFSWSHSDYGDGTSKWGTDENWDEDSCIGDVCDAFEDHPMSTYHVYRSTTPKAIGYDCALITIGELTHIDSTTATSLTWTPDFDLNDGEKFCWLAQANNENPNEGTWGPIGGGKYVETGAVKPCAAAANSNFSSFIVNRGPNVGPASVVNTSCSATHTGSMNYNGANNAMDLQAQFSDPDGAEDLEFTVTALISSNNPGGQCPAGGPTADETVWLGTRGDVFMMQLKSDSYGGSCEAPYCAYSAPYYYYWESAGRSIGDGYVIFMMRPEVGQLGPQYEVYSGLDAGTIHNNCLESDDCIAKIDLFNSTITATGDGLGLIYNWDVALYDNFRTGPLNIFQLALDNYGSYNDPAASLCGGSSVWINTASWITDFDPPTGGAVITRDGDDLCGPLAGDEACFIASAYDELPTDAGLLDIGGWWYQINENVFNLTKPFVIPGSDSWIGFRTISGISGGAILDGGMDDVMDVACNTVDMDVDSPPAFGEAWIRTRLGDVYARGGFSNSIQSEFPVGTGLAMSTYWIGADNANFLFGDFEGVRGSEQQPGWISQNYSDSHSGGGWYGGLGSLADRSICQDEAEAGGDCSYVTGTNLATALAGGRGIYYVGGGTVTGGSSCNAEKVIFVSGNLSIEPQFNETQDADDACLFVVSGNVIVTTGGHASGDVGVDPDIVNAAFIVDGDFSVPDDADDRLEVNGFVVANDTDFGRDLGFAGNSSYPAVYIQYDPRYIYLLGDMLGDTAFTDFECGIVKGSPACDW